MFLNMCEWEGRERHFWHVKSWLENFIESARKKKESKEKKRTENNKQMEKKLQWRNKLTTMSDINLKKTKKLYEL